MHQFLIILSRIKWIGLLGLLGTITGSKLLSLFWLFFLLGLIEIFRNLPVFFQSLQQVISLPLIYLNHRFHLPSQESSARQTEHSLPFVGQWFVVNGGIDKKNSHSWGILPQRYAYDFLILDDKEKTCSGSNQQVENYYCYGKDILAPADGEVVCVKSRYPNSKVYGDGSAECLATDIRGNFITIKHNPGEYSTLAHLMPGSITVKIGDKVSRGQVIARCGNSGNTSEPHLHFQLNDGPSFLASAGLPIRFQNAMITARGENGHSAYIHRGQLVRNSQSIQAFHPHQPD